MGLAMALQEAFSFTDGNNTVHVKVEFIVHHKY
jgi:hypothetical protein